MASSCTANLARKTSSESTDRCETTPTCPTILGLESVASLVFTQNGMLRPWLAQRGLGECSRGLLFFAVPSRGAPLEPGGESPFVGSQAQAVVEWMGNIQVPASAPGATAFAVTELEKLLWNCCFGLLCEHTDASVGTVVDEHDALLTQLADELLHLGMPAFGLDLDLDLEGWA